MTKKDNEIDSGAAADPAGVETKPAPSPAKEEAVAPLKRVAITSLKTDVEAEDGGEWKDAHDLEGVRFRVRSHNFPPYRVAQQRLDRAMMKKYKGLPSVERTQEEYQEEGRLVATYILLGWDGLDVEYSKERALEMLPDREWRKLRTYVELCAMQVGEKEVEFVDGAAKN